MPEPNFINYAISAIAGAFGVGVTWGTMMIKFRQQESRITKVEDRQARLRGEMNGGTPVYMPQTTCADLRVHCHGDSERTALELAQEVVDHSRSIRALENFARWWMQKEGLNITQINDILGVGKRP